MMPERRERTGGRPGILTTVLVVGLVLAVPRPSWPAPTAATPTTPLLLAQGAPPVRSQVTVDSIVALGDSFLAGFSSGGLVETVQRGSLPARLATALTGAGAALAPFEQPLVSEPGLPPLLELVDTAPLVILPKLGIGSALNGDLPRPFDNLAVPGFRLGDALRTVSGNPLTDLVLRDRGTMLEQALELEASLALVWLGLTDAIGPLTSGLVIDGVTLTRLEDFRADLRQIVSALVDAGSEVLLLELPQFDEMPFATYLPPVVVDLESGAPVLQGGETVPLLGPDGPLGRDDLVLLSAYPALLAGQGVPVTAGGSGEALADLLVVSAAERSAVRARIDDYNRQIRTAGRDFGAMVSSAPARAFEEAASSWRQSGCPQGSNEQPFGRFFSLDGVHPSAYGYGILARALIEEVGRATGLELATAPEELCLGRGFVATARWTTSDGETGFAHPARVSSQSGHFWFFDEDNVELTIKVLDGCAINGRHWVFAGGLTDVGVDLVITDTISGQSVTYSSPSGAPFGPIVDVSSFGTCP